MANAVGYTDDDLFNMLHEVHNNHAPFKDEEELEFAMSNIKQQVVKLQFPCSELLYHTAQINSVMNMLLDNNPSNNRRKEFLSTGKVPTALITREALPIFQVIRNIKNLRPLVKKLIEFDNISEDYIIGEYHINKELSLERLLRDTVDANDYLTLLHQFGIVSVNEVVQGLYIFRLSSATYREELIEILKEEG